MINYNLESFLNRYLKVTDQIDILILLCYSEFVHKREQLRWHI